jgi:hypothetical protein
MVEPPFAVPPVAVPPVLACDLPDLASSPQLARAPTARLAKIHCHAVFIGISP